MAQEILIAFWEYMEEHQTAELSAYTEDEKQDLIERFFYKHPEFKNLK